MQKMKYKNMIITFFLVIVPLIKLTIPGRYSSVLTYNILGYPFYVFDFIYVLLGLYAIVVALVEKKDKYDKISILLLLCLLCVFVSNFAIYREDLLLYFFLGSDFFLFGLVLSRYSGRLKAYNKIMILFVVVFLYLCGQIILYSAGIIAYSGDLVGSAETYLRFRTTAGDPNKTAIVIILLLGIILIYERKVKNIFFYIILAFFAEILTGSRGAIITLLICLVFYYFIEIKEIKVKIYVLAIVLGLIFIFSNTTGILENLIERSYEISDSGDFTTGRSVRWGDSFEIFKNSSFLFGSGTGSTSIQRLIDMGNESRILVSPHNFYLSYLVDNGVLIIMLIVYLMYCIVRNVLLSQKRLSAYFFIGIVFISMNMETVIRHAELSILFWLYYYFLMKQDEEFLI